MNSNIKVNVKKPLAKIRLTLLANKAAPSPILGQALGQYGINIMEFCKLFNNRTSNIKDHIYIPLTLTIFSHNSFEITIKTPTTSFLLKNIAKITKGSASAKKDLQETAQGKPFITVEEIFHVGQLKKSYRVMNHLSLKSICKSIISSANSMGLHISTSATAKSSCKL